MRSVAHSDLLLRNRVSKIWWLSRGEVLKWFALHVEHGKTFLQNKNPELEDSSWLEKMCFMDMTSHLTMLNNSLQGKGSTAQQLLEDVLAFEHKLIVFA